MGSDWYTFISVTGTAKIIYLGSESKNIDKNNFCFNISKCSIKIEGNNHIISVIHENEEEVEEEVEEEMEEMKEMEEVKEMKEMKEMEEIEEMEEMKETEMYKKKFLLINFIDDYQVTRIDCIGPYDIKTGETIINYKISFMNKQLHTHNVLISSNYCLRKILGNFNQIE